MGRRTWEGLEDFFAYGHFGGYITASSWRVFVEFVMGGCQDRGPAGGWVRRGLDSCRREALALDGQVWIERRKYQPCGPVRSHVAQHSTETVTVRQFTQNA